MANVRLYVNSLLSFFGGWHLRSIIYVGVKLANPLMTEAIANAKINADAFDARTLSHLLRSDLVAECYVAPKETE